VLLCCSETPVSAARLVADCSGQSFLLHAYLSPAICFLQYHALPSTQGLWHSTAGAGSANAAVTLVGAGVIIAHRSLMTCKQNFCDCTMTAP
jgi:hypothetical protein